MSIEVAIDDLFNEIDSWGFGYLTTVSADDSVHVIALRPMIDRHGDERTLRFDAGGGRACRNAADRPKVSMVFPPRTGSQGMSLIVDGVAQIDGDHVVVEPTWAVMHRPAP